MSLKVARPTHLGVRVRVRARACTDGAWLGILWHVGNREVGWGEEEAKLVCASLGVGPMP